MAGIERTPESAVIRRLKRFRDKYLMSLWNDTRNVQHPGNVDENTATGCNLNILPVDVQFRIMALLTPQDLCRLGSTSYYWRSVVRDPLLWKYFLLRDMPLWPSIDHASMPHLEALEAPLCKDEEDPSQDFMADYLRGSPACRRQWQPPRPAYKAVASFLQSLVVPTEPRFAMFGPGLEQLDVSLLEKLMFSPDVLPVAGIPQRQIGGLREREHALSTRVCRANSSSRMTLITASHPRSRRCVGLWMASSTRQMLKLGEMASGTRRKLRSGPCLTKLWARPRGLSWFCPAWLERNLVEPEQGPLV
ncbi:F-box only protein 4 isoform X2 [Brienomyrus brachyistius]|uniref:F-box only protein 4 isoform X2 n=1 Tax=Brienomyrus brachyistius TaxID=42636 RepID=UPI0020B1BFCE|nr:F-box only protein 4 isoform X2 [Brienomyrus brachyistius]